MGSGRTRMGLLRLHHSFKANPVGAGFLLFWDTKLSVGGRLNAKRREQNNPNGPLLVPGLIRRWVALSARRRTTGLCFTVVDFIC
jgi:hypothetical protein